MSVNDVNRARDNTKLLTSVNKHNYPCKKGSGRLTLTYSKQWLTLPDPFVHGQMCMFGLCGAVQCVLKGVQGRVYMKV